MQRILPASGSHALFKVASTRRLEQRALAFLPPHALMRCAGASVARLALAVAPHAERVWIAAGPGNNGGDGLEAAVHLQRGGKRVEVTLLADEARLPADARDALARARAAGVTILSTVPDPPSAHDIAIDALLGIGSTRAHQGDLAALVDHFNRLACPVLAIDLPSGLNADTGQAWGDHAVLAQHTLALLTLKPGLFTGAGRDHAGTVWLDTLGIAAPKDTPDAWLTGCDTAPAPRRHAQHKGSFGDVAVVGGAAGMTGAALLAAHAAHAAGAGRTLVSLLDTHAAGMRADPARPELMFRSAWWVNPPAVLKKTFVACGCGGGEAVRAVLPRLLGAVEHLLLDADALNAMAADPSLQTMLTARAGRGWQTVLTPHPLEAARLLACSTNEVQADRLSAARRLADGFRCVVVLKGSGSVVAAPNRVPCVNASGNASLASAGTGDVLAGWLVGRWASSDAASTAFDVATLAVAEHGAAAEPLQPGALRAADLIEALHLRLRGGG